MEKVEVGSDLRKVFCGLMVLINLPRVLLDTSIFASACSLFQKYELDALAFVDRPENVKMLVDMHMMIRSGKQDIQSAYFSYHPHCYELTTFMSQSWAFFIFFVGIDISVIHLMPLVVEIIVICLIVKSVRKSNDFRRKSNAKLIPICTTNFMRLLGSCVLRGVLLIALCAGIAPIIWNDPRGLFLGNNMTYLQFLYYSHVLIFSFAKNTFIKVWKVLEQRWKNKHND